MAQFGEILSELRKDHRMTQNDLAKALFVTVGTISNYETGTHFPDIEKLLLLADFFNVSTDYLLGRCKSDLSLDVFDEVLVGERTVRGIIQDLRSLTPDRKRTLVNVLSDMKLGSLAQTESKEKV